MKGKKSPAFADAKGGDNVNTSNHEQDKQHAFDSFCKKVLKNEARNYYDELKQRKDREVTFSGLSEQDIKQLATVDKYFASVHIFSVLGHAVIVNDDLIAEALRSLPESKRDIILLFYFLGLSDKEIGKRLNLIRTTVQYQRAGTLQQLKKFIWGQADEEGQGKK